MKKPLLFLWLLGLLVLCLPLSYVINVKTNTYYNEERFMTLVIICAVVTFLMVGGMSWGLYRFLKKRDKPKPVKNAMLAFTGLVVGVMAVSTVGAEQKIRQRRAYLQKDEMREGFISSCKEQGMKEIGGDLKANNIDSVEVKIDNYCYCMYDRMEADEEIFEKMLDETIPPAEILGDKKVVSMASECALEFFK